MTKSTFPGRKLYSSLLFCFFIFILHPISLHAEKDLSYLTLDSFPHGAAVKLRFQGSETFLGKTPFNTTSFIPGDELEFKIEKEHYNPTIFRIKIRKGENKKAIELEPELRNLMVTTQPTGATVILNGEERGKTPALLEGIQEKQVTLSIQSPLYKNIDDLKINLKKNQLIKRHYKLKPDYGDIQFAVEPAGGVTIDIMTPSGEPVQTGYKAHTIRLPVGNYKVIFKKDGYRTKTLEQQILLLQKKKLSTVLKRTEGLANLMVRTSPALNNAEVEIDGKKAGRLGELFQISPGRHRLKVDTDTRDFYSEVELAEDEFKNLVLPVNMSPPVVVDAYEDSTIFDADTEGLLMITNMDKSRLVRINNRDFQPTIQYRQNKNSGNTQRRVEVLSRLKFKLPLGRHTLEIMENGISTLKKEIRIKANKMMVISASD